MKRAGLRVWIGFIFLGWGCGQGIDVSPPLDVSVQATPDIGEEPLEVTLTASVEGFEDSEDELSFFWDLGDGETSTDAHPTHVFTEPGDVQPRVTVTHGSREGRGETLVRVGPVGYGVDLRLEALEVSTDVINPGGLVDIETTIRNAGTDPVTGTVIVRFFVLADPEFPTDPGAPTGTINLAGIGGYESVQRSTQAFIPPSLAEGNYYVYAFIDGPTNGAVDELDESNNLVRWSEALQVTTGPLPIDLVVSDIAATMPGPFAPGDTIPMSVDIANQGTLASGDFEIQVRMSIDPKLALLSDDLPVATAEVDSIPPQSSTTLDIDVTLPLGSLDNRPYYFGAIADKGAAVPESDETNNTTLASDLIYIAGGSGCTEDGYEPNETSGTAQPLDLTSHTALVVCPYSVDWYALELEVGDQVQAHAQFVSAAGQPGLALFAPGASSPTQQGTGSNQVLPTGLVLANGTWLARIEHADATQAVGYDLDFAVTKSGGDGRDLLLHQPAVSPSTIVAGGSLSVSFDVYNTGSMDLPAATPARILLSADDVPDGSDVVLGTQTIQALSSVGHQAVSMSTPIPDDQAEGSYRVLIVLDADDTIAETYEDNNTASFPLTVQAAD